MVKNKLIREDDLKTSMYNMLFGKNHFADFILESLDLTEEDCGRFRDAFVAGGEIAIYTRNGGENRENQKKAIDWLKNHPCYLRDQDDNYDSTYATFYFSIPEEHKEAMLVMDNGPIDFSQRWKDRLNNITEKDMENFKPIMDVIFNLKGKWG